MSEYLTILDAKRRAAITKFLTGNHYLPINANRFKKPDEPDKPTICTFCPNKGIGDELHYLLHCKAFDKDRNYCPHLECIALSDSPASEKFDQIFARNDPGALSKLSKFIGKILDFFTPRDDEDTLTELPVRKIHVTRAGRTSVRPKHLDAFFV